MIDILNINKNTPIAALESEGKNKEARKNNLVFYDDSNSLILVGFR